MDKWHIIHIKTELCFSYVLVYFVAITILTKSTLYLFPFLAHGVASSFLSVVYLVLSGVIAKRFYKKLDSFFHIKVFRNPY